MKEWQHVHVFNGNLEEYETKEHDNREVMACILKQTPNATL